MKKWIKRIILISAILIVVLFVYVFVGFYYMFYQERQSFAAGMKNVEGSRVKAELFAKAQEIVMIEKQGEKYEKEGKYDLAIEQYKKAMEMGGPEWVERASLADVYTKSGQYELALEEINWLMPRIARQEVKDDYLIRKQLLEKLIESQKAVDVPNIDQTAFLFHRITELKGN